MVAVHRELSQYWYAFLESILNSIHLYRNSKPDLVQSRKEKIGNHPGNTINGSDLKKLSKKSLNGPKRFPRRPKLFPERVSLNLDR